MVQGASRRMYGCTGLVVTSLLLASCASRHPTSLADSFVEKGEPHLVMGDSTHNADNLLDPDAKPPPLEDLEVVRSASFAPAASRLEDSDPELSNALVVAEARPSPAAHRRVAELYQGHASWIWHTTIYSTRSASIRVIRPRRTPSPDCGGGGASSG